MTPRKITYGERYSDDSGWERFLNVDADNRTVTLSLVGCDHHIDLEHMDWLVLAYLEAREKLDMDKLVPAGPTPPTSGEQS